MKPESDVLREGWETWAKTNTAELAFAEPALPDELSDHAQDVWEPLLAIADLAGGDWPKRAACRRGRVVHNRGEDEKSIGRRLLADIRDVFDDPDRDDPHDEAHGHVIASGALATTLAAVEGAPWAEWSHDDKPIRRRRSQECSALSTSGRPVQGPRPEGSRVPARRLRGRLAPTPARER